MRFAPYVTRVDRIALAIGFRTSAAQDSAPDEPHGGALGVKSRGVVYDVVV
jgi:hypothetical protein